MLTAQDFHEREARDLAPWAVRAEYSDERAYGVSEEQGRTCFQRDRDRLIHSRSFRRLAYKTQVFVNDHGDLYRSRLTHTMELAQLARSTARQLGANEDLVECVALAHDLGHPPFGHRGEDLLSELMAGHGGFDHHHQALRIIEELEVRYPDYPGLNLTLMVRDSLAKLGCCEDRTRVPARYDQSLGPVLEAQLVDELDAVTYLCHDIDDGLRAGLLDLRALDDIELWQGAMAQAQDASPRSTSDKLLADIALRILLDAFQDDLIASTQRRLEEEKPSTLMSVRAMDTALVTPSPSMRRAREGLADWLFENLYRHWRINRTFHRARCILAELFEFLCEHVDTLPHDHQERAERLGRERAVSDYIAGMTDRYAVEVHGQIRP